MAPSFHIHKNHYPFACTLQSIKGLAHKGYQPNHKIIGFDGPGGNVAIIPISTNVGDPYKYKFGGKEYQEEFDVNLYDFGARNYDAALGRWMNVDPLAEDYYSQSSYQYTLNNPIVYIDPDGMKVDMTHLMKTGNEGLQTAIGMLFDLIEQTGLSLSIQKNKDGRFMLEYDTDSTNEWMYEIDGVRAGSEDARSQLKGMIDDPNVALVGLSPDNRGSGVPQGSNIIYMDPVQIESHIENVSEGLNSRTMGYGMTFLHESYHTAMGGGLRDTENEYEQGPVVKKMNVIRNQLDDNLWNRTRGKGTQYGERKYYMANDGRSSRSNGVKIIKATMHFRILDKKGNKIKASTRTQKQKSKN